MADEVREQRLKKLFQFFVEEKKKQSGLRTVIGRGRDTIWSLQQQIPCDRSKYSVVLYYQGKELEGGVLVADCGVPDNGTLEMELVKIIDEPIPVELRSEIGSQELQSSTESRSNTQ